MNRWLAKLLGSVLFVLWTIGPALNAQDDPFLQDNPVVLPDDAGGFGLETPQPTAEEEMQARVLEIFQEGQTLLEAGDQGKAWEKFNEAATTSRMTHLPSLLGKAKLERDQGFLQQSLQSLQAAVTYSQGNRDAYLDLGQVLIELERYEDAIANFQSALISQPRDAELLYYQGLAEAEFAYSQQFADAESRRLDLQTAVGSLDLALLLKPDYPEALFERGRARMSLGLMDEALEDLQQSASLDPENEETAAELGFGSLRRAATEANARMGQRAQITQDYQTAINYFTRYFDIVGPKPPVPAAEEDEEDPDAIRRENVFINRSAAYIGLAEERGTDRNGLLQNAIRDTQAAIELDPNIPDAYFQKGIAHRLLNDFESAIDAFSESLEISPANSEAYLRRGIIYFRRGDYQLAKVDFEDSIQYAVRSPRASFWLGVTYAKLDKPSRAIEAYNAALRTQPRFPLAYINRGLAQMKIGRFERAVRDFNEVLQRDRQNVWAKSMRDQALQMSKSRG